MSESGTGKTSGELLGYASPTPLARVGEVMRDGGMLVARDGATLPPRCVLCGAAGIKAPLTLRFSWDTSFKVTTDASSLQLRQKGLVHASFCAAHRGKWAWGFRVGLAGIILSLLTMAAGMVIAVISESTDVPRYTPLGIGVMIAGFAVLILSLFVFTLRTRTLSCERIEAGYLYLAGAGEGFLRGLPTLPETAKR